MDRLEGKVAVVTGGARGIGKALCEVFAREGAAVVVGDVQLDLARSVAGAIVESGGKALAVPLDVGDKSQVTACFEAAVRQFGGVDALLNNAGINRDAFLTKMTEEQWDNVLRVDLKGAFLCAQAFAQVNSASGAGGAIVNISSISGLRGNMGQVNYSAAKSGLVGMTKTMALELARFNIRVNAIAPGFIDTEMTRVVPEKVREICKAQIPIGRIGSPEEVAKVALFLCCDDSSYVTGQTLSVNGGWYM
ncbi:MAG: 3-oxoacyl-ACP reductase FabG [Firmicutes bacterium]|nr:3-oxoacyl-ACP reductase FabG [Bacillota bacterium]